MESAEIIRFINQKSLSPRNGMSKILIHKNGFKLESSIYDELREYLEVTRKKSNKQYPPSTIPSRKHLEHLMETAFWASQQREEGRLVKFVIGYYDSVSSTGLTFATPMQFTDKNLIKLSPAVIN